LFKSKESYYTRISSIVRKNTQASTISLNFSFHEVLSTVGYTVKALPERGAFFALVVHEKIRKIVI